MRIYDPRLGRFLSIDPLAPKYPHYSPYLFAGNKPISHTDYDGCGPRYAALAAAFQARLEELGVSFKKVEFTEIDHKIIITASVQMHNQTLTKTFTFSDKTVDYESTDLLTDWGVDSYDAMIAGSNSWTKRANYRLAQLDQHYKKPENGIPLLLKIGATIVTMGSWAEIEGGLLSLEGLFMATDAAFILNDASTVIYGKNKSFLVNELGIPEGVLNNLQLVNDGAQFFTGLKGLINNAKEEMLAKANGDVKKVKNPSLISQADLLVDEINFILNVGELMKPEEKKPSANQKNN